MQKIYSKIALIKFILLFSLFISPPFVIKLASHEKDNNLILIPRKASSALGVNINLAIPLFVAPVGPGGQFSAKLGVNPGGLGSLIYQFFILDTLSLGAELKYDFLFDKNYRLDFLNPELNRGYILHIVPLVFKVTQYFDFLRQLSIFIEGNVGASILAYGEKVEGVKKRTIDFSPTLGIGLGTLWNLSPRWSLGLALNWWNYFEFGAKGSTPYVLSTLDLGIRLNFAIRN